MGIHSIETRIAVDPETELITVVIFCGHCGTREEFSFRIGHLAPVLDSLVSMAHDQKLPAPKTPFFRTKEDIETKEELDRRLKQTNKN